MTTLFEKELEEFNAGNAMLDFRIDAIERADEEGLPRPDLDEFQEVGSVGPAVE